MTLFCKSNCPTANLSGTNLVLSLPDAMTPVVWMIDTKESGSFFMRVDKDENGLYILQKVEGSGKNVKIEDVAFYADKGKAVKAMSAIGKVLDGSGTGTKSSGSALWRFTKFFVTALLLAFFIIGIWGIALLKGWIGEDIPSIRQAQQTPQVEEPYVSNNPNAVGVPMSADDYIKERKKVMLPF